MPSSRRRLHIIFEDRPAEAVAVDRAWLQGLSADEAFDKGSTAGVLFERKIRAMWVVDFSASEEVRRLYGQAPPEIHKRYERFLSQAE